MEQGFMGLGGMWLFPLLVIGASLMCVFMMFGHRNSGSSHQDHNPGSSSGTALEILKRRYAKGEITKGDFDRMRGDLN